MNRFRNENDDVIVCLGWGLATLAGALLFLVMIAAFFNENIL